LNLGGEEREREIEMMNFGGGGGADMFYEKVSELNRVPFQLGIFKEGDSVVNWNIELHLPATKFISKLMFLFLGYAAWTRRRCLQSVTRERYSRLSEPVGYSALLVALAFPYALETGLSARDKGSLRRMILNLVFIVGIAYIGAIFIADLKVNKHDLWSPSRLWKSLFVLVHVACTLVIAMDEFKDMFPEYFTSVPDLSIPILSIYIFVFVVLMMNYIDVLSYIIARASFCICGRVHTARFLFKHLGLSLRQLRLHGVSLRELGTVLQNARKHGRRANAVSVSDLRKAGYDGDARQFIQQAGFSASTFTRVELKQAGYSPEEIRKLVKTENVFIKKTEDISLTKKDVLLIKKNK
jgi:hypothetical protein